MSDLCDLSAVELRRLIATRTISPVELLASCRTRIEQANPCLNAFVTLDLERAEAAAREAERAVRAGESQGLLHGLPVGIKDLALTRGLRTTFGSPQFSDFVPEADELQMARIRAAGGIVVGKTNTPEFGAGANTVNAVFGATGNPFDPELTVAGSSGGSAAALAIGMVPLATGSDVGGSLRNPAAYTGTVGFRPSPGVVPSELRRLGWSPLSVNGPMARSLADLKLLFEAMAGFDPEDPLAAPGLPRPDDHEIELKRLRVAVSADLGFAPLSATIRATFQAAMARLADAFAVFDARDPDMSGADEAFAGMRAQTFLAQHAETYARNPEVFGPNVRANIEQGLAMSLADAARAHRLQTEIYRRFQAFMADYDVLICPALPVPPFPHTKLYVDEIDGRPLSSYFHWLALPYGLTLTQHPVVCLPCGRDATGMPFGIQVCGRRHGDLRLLAIAEALEAHLQAIPELARPVPDLAALSAHV